jgi:4-hydroxy-tetrahydrodipicolinate synthase
MIKPYGILPAILTPMNEDESINEKELRAHINRMIDAGVHGLFCLGTNGEFYALTHEEKLEVMQIVADENRGRLPLYAGTGCITTKDTIRLTRKAVETGMNAVSIVSPYYIGVTQEDLFNHYRDIAEEVDIPIILYNIPARTGNNIEAKTVSKLMEYKNIIGIKDSSGNFDNTLKYLEVARKEFAVLAGNDSLVLWTLLAGGAGGISGIANIMPGLLVKIYEFWKKGNMEEARKAQDAVRPMRECFRFGNPNSIVKRAVNLLGYPAGPARKPVNLGGNKLDEELLAVLESYKKEMQL